MCAVTFDALDICNTIHDSDLVLMGHSMPQKDKMALFEALTPNCEAPIVIDPSSRRHAPIPQANYAVDSNDGQAAPVEML